MSEDQILSLVESKSLLVVHSINFLLFPVSSIQLDKVMHQDEQDLIDAINQLCTGNPSHTSVQLIHTLQRPIPKTDKSFHKWNKF